MHYQIILFDLDDTLIDFAASEAISLRTLKEAFYPNTDYQIFAKKYKEINSALWKRVGAENNALMPSEVRLLRFQQLNEHITCQVSAHEVAREYDHLLGEHAQWLPDVKKAIQFLHQKGHIMGIITNGLSDAQGKKRQRLELHNWFDCFVVSDEVGIAKPQKEIFDIALEEIADKHQQPLHAFNKNKMLMVGDSLISDGLGAMNFGINYCHVNNQNTEIESFEANIAYRINSVADLPLHIGYTEEYPFF